MDIVDILAVSVGLSLYIFLLTQEIGATQNDLEKKRMTALGLAFSGMQILLIAVGILVVYVFGSLLKMSNQTFLVISFAILFVLGLREIRMSWKEKDFHEELRERLTLKDCLKSSFKTGLASLAIGIGAWFFYPEKIISVLIMAVCAVFSAAIGLWVGYWFGCIGRQKIGFCSGAVFLLVAVRIAVL